MRVQQPPLPLGAGRGEGSSPARGLCGRETSDPARRAGPQVALTLALPLRERGQDARLATTGALLLRALCLALALVWLIAGTARADALDDETRRIAKQLQCPVCESVSVADSPSELAGQMRGVIRRKLEQGETEAEILAYFVERYGEGVLTEPPRRGLSLAVWLGPVLVLAGGGVVLGLLLRRWAKPRWIRLPARRNGTGPVSPDVASAGPVHDVGDYAERARRELEGFRKGM